MANASPMPQPKPEADDDESGLSLPKIIGISIAAFVVMLGVTGYVIAERHFGGLIEAEIKRFTTQHNIQYADYKFSLWNQGVTLGSIKAVRGRDSAFIKKVRTSGVQWETEPEFRIIGVSKATATDAVIHANTATPPTDIKATELIIHNPRETAELAALKGQPDPKALGKALVRAMTGITASNLEILKMNSSSNQMEPSLTMAEMEWSQSDPANVDSFDMSLTARDIVTPNVSTTVNSIQMESDWDKSGEANINLTGTIDGDMTVSFSTTVLGSPDLRDTPAMDRASKTGSMIPKTITAELNLGKNQMSEELRKQIGKMAPVVGMQARSIGMDRSQAVDAAKELGKLGERQANSLRLNISQKGELSMAQLQGQRDMSKLFDITLKAE